MGLSRAGSMSSKVVVTREDAKRLDAFVLRCGGRYGASVQVAANRLGMGLTTVINGMEQGRMLQSTRDRLFAALDREEAAEQLKA